MSPPFPPPAPSIYSPSLLKFIFSISSLILHACANAFLHFQSFNTFSLWQGAWWHSGRDGGREIPESST